MDPQTFSFGSNMASPQSVPTQPALFSPRQSTAESDGQQQQEQHQHQQQHLLSPSRDSHFTAQMHPPSHSFDHPPPSHQNYQPLNNANSTNNTASANSANNANSSSMPPALPHELSSPRLGPDSSNTLLDLLKIPKSKATGSPSTPAYSAFTADSTAADSPASSSMPSVPQIPPPSMMPFLPTSFDNSSVASGFRDYQDFTPPPKPSKHARTYLLAMLAEKSASDQNSAQPNDQKNNTSNGSNTMSSLSPPSLPPPQPLAVFSSPPQEEVGLPYLDSQRPLPERTLPDGKNSTGLKSSEQPSASGSMSSGETTAQRVASHPGSDANAPDVQKLQTQVDSKLVLENDINADDLDGKRSNNSRHPIETFLFPLSPFCAITLTTSLESVPPLSVTKCSTLTEFATALPFAPSAGHSLLNASPSSLVFISPNSKCGAHVFNSRTGSEIILADQTPPIGEVFISWERDIAQPFSEFVISTATDFDAVYFSQLQGSWQGSSIAFIPTGAEGLQLRAKPSERHSDVFAISAGQFVRLVHPLQELSKARTDVPGPIRVSLPIRPDVCIDAGDTIVDFAFSSDDTSLVTFDASGALKFWDIRANSNGHSKSLIIDPVRTQPPLRPIKVYDTILDDAYQPASVMFLDLEKPYLESNPHRYVLLGFQQNHLLQLWDLQLGKCVQELRLPFTAGDESKCRVTYHQQSGFLCVFHPNRNSMLFLSLSFPQYRLLEQASAGALSKSSFDQLARTQAGYLSLISSPKEARPPENTVIMKGVTEVSLSSFGQIHDFAIRNVDVSRSAAHNRKSEQDDTKDGNEKKSRRHKKKIEQHTLFELFVVYSHGISSYILRPEQIGYYSDLKPILPIEPNSNTEFLRLTSISKAPPPASMPRSQKIPSPALVDLTPSARNVLPTTNSPHQKSSVGHAKPPAEQHKTQPSNAYSGPGLEEDDDPTYQSVLEEDDDHEFPHPVPDAIVQPQFDVGRIEDHLATKFDVLSQTLAMKHQVYVDSTSDILQQRSAQLEDTLRRNLNQAVQSQLKTTSTNIEKIVQRVNHDLQTDFKSLTTSLVNDVRHAIDGSFSNIRASIIKVTSEQVNAAANKAADRAIREIGKLLSEQQLHADRRRRQDEEKLDKMMEMINNIGLGGMPSPDIDAKSQGEIKTIRKLLRESSAEDAVLAWLGSSRQAELFDEVFVDRGPDFISRLSPESALAVSAVVTTSLEGQAVEYRLKWVCAIISHLESALKKSKDPELLRIIPHVMNILTSRLTSAKAKFQQDGETKLLDMLAMTQNQIADLAKVCEKPTAAVSAPSAPTAPKAPRAPSASSMGNMWMGSYGDPSDSGFLVGMR